MALVDDAARISYFEGSPAYRLRQEQLEADGAEIVVNRGRDGEYRMQNVAITAENLKFSIHSAGGTASFTHCRLNARDNPVAAGMLRHLADAGAREAAPSARINPTSPAQPMTLMTHIVIPRFTPAPRSRYALIFNDRPYDAAALEIAGAAYLHRIDRHILLALLTADPDEQARARRAFGLAP